MGTRTSGFRWPIISDERTVSDDRPSTLYPETGALPGGPRAKDRGIEFRQGHLDGAIRFGAAEGDVEHVIAVRIDLGHDAGVGSDVAPADDAVAVRVSAEAALAVAGGDAIELKGDRRG